MPRAHVTTPGWTVHQKEIYRVETVDGAVPLGTLVAETEEVVVVLKTSEFGEVTLDRANVESMEEIDPDRIRNGRSEELTNSDASVQYSREGAEASVRHLLCDPEVGKQRVQSQEAQIKNEVGRPPCSVSPRPVLDALAQNGKSIRKN